MRIQDKPLFQATKQGFCTDLQALPLSRSSCCSLPLYSREHLKNGNIFSTSATPLTVTVPVAFYRCSTWWLHIGRSSCCSPPPWRTGLGRKGICEHELLSSFLHCPKEQRQSNQHYVNKRSQMDVIFTSYERKRIQRAAWQIQYFTRWFSRLLLSTCH